MADEKQHLTDSRSRAKPRGYGAAVAATAGSDGPPRSTTLVTHKVCKSDSLSSLAIQYSTSIADIKRVNKLWSSESMTFRDTIDIPVCNDQLPNDSRTSRGSLPSTSQLSGTSDTSHSPLSATSAPSTSSATAAVSDSSLTLTSGVNDNGTMSTSDFFAKFDKSLTLIKKKVEHQTAGAAEYLEEVDDDVLYHSPTRPKQSSQNGIGAKGSKGSSKGKESGRKGSSSSRSKSSSEDIRLTPEPVIRAKVKKKMEKYEKRQSELFSL